MKHLKMRLETESIKAAIEELKDYRDSLAVKNEAFVNRLLEVGITVARENSGGFGKYLSFKKEVEGTTHCVGIMQGSDAQKIISTWEVQDGTRTAIVSPILMAEFGSGLLAEVLLPVSGVGTGTFPEQTHATDPLGWWWKDLNGAWHHSRGVKPTHPMYYADMAILDQVISIAREVFGNDI